VWMHVLSNLILSKSSFIRGTLILYQSHHGVYACILGLATMSGGDGMDSTLKYMLSGVHELMWPHPVVPGA
jgi:hypothetical protein